MMHCSVSITSTDASGASYVSFVIVSVFISVCVLCFVSRLEQAVDDGLDDAFHHRVGDGAGVEVVVETVFFLQGKAVVGDEGGPVVAPGVVPECSLLVQHFVQGDDVRALFMRIQPGVIVVVRGDRAEDDLDAGHFGHGGHVQDVVDDFVLGDALGEVIGAAHDDDHLRVQGDDILLEPLEHLHGVLAADALVDIAVAAEEARMELHGDVVAVVRHIRAVEGNQHGKFGLAVAGRGARPLPGDAVAHEDGRDAGGNAQEHRKVAV